MKNIKKFLFLPIVFIMANAAHAAAPVAEPTPVPEPVQAVKQVVLPMEDIKPFGYNIFSGMSAALSKEGVNPNYKIVPGDEISVQIWGATNFDSVMKVDTSGNIFIPDVGPVKVAGVRESQLNQLMKDKVGGVYRDNVSIYTNLKESMPVSIFVSGAVTTPGRYEGTANDSIIDYIKKAGGIDLERGSFRDVQIKRFNKREETFDIYSFLKDGDLPETTLEDGDTILVTDRGMKVSVNGEALQRYSFEFKSDSIKGSELEKYAQPTPGATHAIIGGMRDGKPMKKYMKLAEFHDFDLRNDDRVTFEAGEHGDNIRVSISGLHNGNKTMVLPLDAKLTEVLNNVPVDRNVSDLDAVYVKRKSVAAKQKLAISESLKRLQESLILARASGTTEKSPIGNGEVALLKSFTDRAEAVEPEGRVVVQNKNGFGHMLLEDGDEIVIPQKTDLVMVDGEVLIPKAILWEDGLTVNDYVQKSGGFSQNANEDDIVVLHANGESEVGTDIRLREGDEIMVMPEIKLNSLEVTGQVMEILYKVAVAAAIPFKL